MGTWRVPTRVGAAGPGARGAVVAGAVRVLPAGGSAVTSGGDRSWCCSSFSCCGDTLGWAVPGGWKGSGRIPSARPEGCSAQVMCEQGEMGPCAPWPAGSGAVTHGIRASCVGRDTAGTGRDLSRSSRGQSPCCALGHWDVWPPGEAGDTAYPCVQIGHRVCTRLGYSRIRGWGHVGCSQIPALTGVWGKVSVPRCVPPALGRDRN